MLNRGSVPARRLGEAFDNRLPAVEISIIAAVNPADHRVRSERRNELCRGLVRIYDDARNVELMLKRDVLLQLRERCVGLAAERYPQESAQDLRLCRGALRGRGKKRTTRGREGSSHGSTIAVVLHRVGRLTPPRRFPSARKLRRCAFHVRQDGRPCETRDACSDNSDVARAGQAIGDGGPA